MQILVLNPGGNSLKAQIVECAPDQSYAFEAKERASLGVEGIGKQARLLRYQDKSVTATEPVHADSYGAAADLIFKKLGLSANGTDAKAGEIDRIGIRVVHGGADMTAPMEMTDEVVRRIEALEKLAPLHNKSSLEVLKVAREHLRKVPILAVFDTAFHRTIPEEAALYAIPPELSEKHQIRRYGFHGISHRYLLERYAHLAGKPPESCSIVTMHLESGCSVTAIRNGRSVDNTMGLTPLEGLMMGTRSGDVDPSLIPLLIREEGMDLDAVMELLNKGSGLLAVSGVSLDTRILAQQYGSNARVKLAMDMFNYRALKAVTAYMGILGGCEAIVFGGGIGENNTMLRRYIGDNLRWCGIEIDSELNERLIDTEGKLNLASASIAAWVIPTEEGLQIAHECSKGEV